jgi:hypothetical protein
MRSRTCSIPAKYKGARIERAIQGKEQRLKIHQQRDKDFPPPLRRTLGGGNAFRILETLLSRQKVPRAGRVYRASARCPREWRVL